jgi:hypothetical protein
MGAKIDYVATFELLRTILDLKELTAETKVAEISKAVDKILAEAKSK